MNRNMSGTLRNIEVGQGDISNAPRSLGNGHNSRPSSPLKFFAKAKSKSTDIFKGIAEYVKDAEKFLKETKGPENQECQTVHSFHEMTEGILEKLTRDHMKVVFFGRTSNGKSTVINAMLRDKILPSGIGHTTHCFVQVEGTDNSEGFLLTDDSTDPKSIGNIKQLASALSSVKLKEDSVVRILWPKDKCRLLREDVVFVDSPGIDVSPDLDTWIDKFCMDADVFVLVGNAESTLMQTEKNFFHKVSHRLSKPNIFILQNRWDVSVNEEDADEVKEQHYTRNTEFLTDELKVAEKDEAKNRIFFVSAKEALVSRLHEDAQTPTPTGVLQRNYAERLFAFANFERSFELCISKSAVQTKFQTHTERGKKITADLKDIMERTYVECLDDCEDKAKKRQETADELEFLAKQLVLLTNEIKDNIKSMVEEVERNVSFALNDEIKRLWALVDEFDRPFHPDNLVLNVYKKELNKFIDHALCRNLEGKCSGSLLKQVHCVQQAIAGILIDLDELHKHVEEGLGRNLQQRCSYVLQQHVEGTQKEMTDRLAALLNEEEKSQLMNSLPKRDFEIAYKLDCRNLCSEFQEDIQFRFSLGIGTLMKRFLGSQGAKNTLSGGGNYVHRPLGTPMTPRAEFQQQDNQVLLSLISAFSTLAGRNTLLGATVLGIGIKCVGWKIFATFGGLYIGLYFYEWMCWTNKAKERKFKSQYVEYAASKLRLIVDLTSSNCSHQVQQELSSTFARLCNYVDMSKDNLKDELLKLDKDIRKLEDTSKQAKSLRNKADWLDKELNTFIEEFLQLYD